MGGVGSWEAPEAICRGIQEVTLCLDPRPSLVPTRYGAREHVFICLDLSMRRNFIVPLTSETICRQPGKYITMSTLGTRGSSRVEC